jgi:hypothetical protein
MAICFPGDFPAASKALPGKSESIVEIGVTQDLEVNQGVLSLSKAAIREPFVRSCCTDRSAQSSHNATPFAFEDAARAGQ